MKDSSLFFLVLSCACIWLVLDQIVGNKLITQLVENILPSSKKEKTNDKDVTIDDNLQGDFANPDKKTDGDTVTV